MSKTVQRRNTHQRRLVLETVRSLGTHPKVGEIYEHVHEKDPKVSLGTVYRNLNLLADDGTILAIKTSGGYHYDRRTDNHSHIVCPSCGTMVDTELSYNPDADAKVEAALGYKDVSHYTVYEGLCPACQVSQPCES